MGLLWLLFIEFVIIGTFSVGGGLATLPFLINLSSKYDWYTMPELIDMIAISESTPGPIGINMATYVGYRVSGIPGSLVASLAVMFTGVVFMLIVGRQLERFKNSPWLKKIFYGLRPTIAALIAFAAYTMLSTIVSGDFVVVTTIGLFIVSLVLIVKTKLSPITIIAMAALASLVIPF